MAINLRTSLSFVGTGICAAAVTFDLGWVSSNHSHRFSEFSMLFGELAFCSQSAKWGDEIPNGSLQKPYRPRWVMKVVCFTECVEFGKDVDIFHLA